MEHNKIDLIVYLQRYTKFQKEMEKLGFKRLRPMPERARISEYDEMQKYRKEISKDDYQQKVGEMITELSKIFYINTFNYPMIGRKCIGKFYVSNFPGDFDQFLHI